MKKYLRIALAAVACAGLSHGALAQQNYPNRPIRIIVPYPAGESVDVIARLLALRLAPLLGQQVIVDNRGGGGGVIGASLAAQATPDGYNLLYGNVGAIIIAPNLQAKPPYDALKNFAPVSQIADVPFFIFVSPAALTAKTLKELVSYARDNPGKINYASTGIGSGVHLAGELFKAQAKIDIVHVPYKGVGLALPDMVAGKIQMVFYPPTFLQFVKEGKLRAIAIAAPARSALLPDVPTTGESGMPDLIASSWHAIVAPAGVPAENIKKFHTALTTVMADKEVREKMAGVGADPIGSTPEKFGPFMRTEVEKWRKVIKTSGVTVD
jgi:tripartite-type tricarboxylate transporter receptor subunit TctC